MGSNGNDYWKKKYDSLLQGALALEQQLREAARVNSALMMEKKLWEADKIMQAAVIAQAVNAANLTAQAQGLEIQQLKTEIKRLKGE